MGQLVAELVDDLDLEARGGDAGRLQAVELVLALPAGEKWITTSDVNRLVLREDESADDAKARFQIVAGL